MRKHTKVLVISYKSTTLICRCFSATLVQAASLSQMGITFVIIWTFQRSGLNYIELTAVAFKNGIWWSSNYTVSLKKKSIIQEWGFRGSWKLYACLEQGLREQFGMYVCSAKMTTMKPPLMPIIDNSDMWTKEAFTNILLVTILLATSKSYIKILTNLIPPQQEKAYRLHIEALNG